MFSSDRSVSRFRRRIVASVLLPSGFFFVALLVALNLVRYLWEADRAVIHSELVLAQANETFRRVATSQSTVRGYILYERPRFLETYQGSKTRIWNEMAELSKLTADNPEQQAALRELEPLLTQFLDFSDRALAAKELGAKLSWGDAQEVLAVRIRDGFYGFVEREERLRSQRREHSQQLVERSVWAMALGVVLLGGGVSYYLRRLLRVLLSNYSQVLKAAEDGAAVRERDYFFAMPVHLMCISGQEGYFKQLSLGWERVLGYTREELMGRPFVEFVRPEDRERTEVVKQEADRSEQSGFTNCYIHKDGHEVWLRWSSSPRPESGLVYSTAVDVTAQHRAEQEIFRLNADLQSKLEELDRLNQELESFAYSVSHDLRSPLRALDGFAQALLRTKADQLDEQGQQFLNRIKLAAQRMGELIDDLLLLSRVTRAEIKMAEIDLTAMAEDILRELRLESPFRLVASDVEPGLRMRGDASLMRVMLSNLLSNAWKYTGNVERAEITFGREGDVFCVRDNGAGFDMEYQDKLFVPFQRLHRAGEFEGTGVGLATVQRVVRRLGGKIWAESEVGKGAAFYFRWTEEDKP